MKKISRDRIRSSHGNARIRRRKFRQSIFENLETRCLLNSDWQNTNRPSDVNNDFAVSPLDALAIINVLNSKRRGGGSAVLPERKDPLALFVDTNGDSRVTPLDVLAVVNTLNRHRTYQPAQLNRIEGDAEPNPIGFISIVLGGLEGNQNQLIDLTTQMTIGQEEFNEMGLFVVDGPDGAVNGILPSSPNYPSTVFSSTQRQVLYSKRSTLKSSQDTTFPAGSTLGVYVLQSTSDDSDPAKHLRVRKTGSSSIRIGWEEHAYSSAWPLVGDRGYDDVLVDVQFSQPYTGNAEPVITAIPNQSINELSLFSLATVAMDANIPDDVLTYTLDLAPTGASIDPNTGVFSWIPTEVQGPGNFEVIIRATDRQGSFDTESFFLTVLEVNALPVISPQANPTVSVGTQLSMSFTASDADIPKQKLKFSLNSNAPQGAAINEANGLLTWIPDSTFAGKTVPIVIRATDSSGAKTELEILVSVIQTAARPSLSAIPDWSINEDTLLQFSALVNNLDKVAGPVKFELIPEAPAGATINPTTGRFTWTPTEANGPGSFPVTVRVTDAAGAFDSKSFTVTVNEVNTAPVLAAIANQTVNELTPLVVQASATDADLPANTLVYSLTTAPTGATINPSTGRFTWTPTEANGPGSFPVTVRVTDAAGAFDSKSFTVTVNEVNTAPVLAAIANQTVNELTPLVVQASATDADLPANTLVYSLTTAPTGATINPSTGRFTWTPTEANGPGSFPVTVRVTDAAGLFDAKSFTITVNEVNTAPVLAAIANQTVNELTPLVVQASASDADLPANTLVYSLTAAPTGATINPSTGRFTWTPTEANGPGSFPVTVRVTDAAGAFDSKSFTVTVNEVNTAPVLAAIANQTVNELTPLVVQASATDADLPANTLVYSLTTAPTGATINPSTGRFTWTPTEANGPGSFPVTVRVTDAAGAFDSKSFTVTVNEVNIAPTVAPVEDRVIQPGQTITLNIQATDPDVPANQLIYSLGSPARPGMSISPSSGLFQWAVPSRIANGTYPVTILVADNGISPRSTTVTFNISVADSNNCAFDSNLTGWTTVETGGSQAGSGSIIPLSCTAVLTEGDSYLLSLEKEIIVPASPSAISVTFADLRFDNSSSNQINDAFEIALLDSTGESAVTTITREGTALLNITEGFPTQVATGVTFSNNNLLIGLNGLQVGSNVRLVIRLVNNDSDTTSQITITDYQIIDSGLLASQALAPTSPYLTGKTPAIYGPIALSAVLPQENVSSPINPSAPILSVNSTASSLLVGSELILNGSAQPVQQTGQPTNKIAMISINGQVADRVDVAGNFFHSVSILPGQNTFSVRVMDNFGQATTQIIRIMGVSREVYDLDFSNLADVTSSFLGVYGRTSINSTENQLLVELAGRNTHQLPKEAPLLVVVKNISDPSVRVLDYDGTTPSGERYFNFTDFINDGILAPGEQTVSPLIKFYNPRKTQFKYELAFFSSASAGLNIVSLPVTEISVGKAYSYPVVVDKVDRQTSFSLIESPVGMTINQTNGLISWQPTSSNFGSNRVSVLARDTQGGSSIQTYYLNVISPPPNRPPLFTTNPVTIGRVGEDYIYQATATDPDQDAVTYSLSVAPDGMTINPSTGLVIWPKALLNVGHIDVTIVATDTTGARAFQSYTFLVTGAIGNLPPTITSTPGPNYNLPLASNSGTGNVVPNSIVLNLENSQTSNETVSITLPANPSQQGTADVLFLLDAGTPVTPSKIDPSGDWIGDLAVVLDDTLTQNGVEQNRFGYMDFGQLGGRVTMRQVREMQAAAYYDVDEYQQTGNIISGDIDNDGDLDFINFVANGHVFINDGTGVFEETYRIESTFIDEAFLYDVDLDGKLDFIANERAYVSIYFGNGDGTFEQQISYGSAIINSLCVIDFDSNGQVDLAAVTDTNSVLVFSNVNEKGLIDPIILKFGADFPPLLNFTQRVRQGDFNGDGLDDVLILGNNGSYIAWSSGNGLEIQSIVLDNLGNVVDCVDFNNDGITDIVSSTTNGGLYLYLGSAQGIFDSPVFISWFAIPDAHFHASISFADMDQDGNIDFVFNAYNVFGGNSNRVAILYGDGKHSISARHDFGARNPYASAVTAFDATGDGYPDVLQTMQNGYGFNTRNHIAFYENDGNGGLNADLAGIGSLYPVDILAFQLDNDDLLDLAVLSNDANIALPVTSQLQVLVASESNIFKVKSQVHVDGIAIRVRHVDFDDDGDSDLVILSNNSDSNSYIYFFENDGNANFSLSLNPLKAPSHSTDIELYDFNFDGRSDFIVTTAAGVFVSFATDRSWTALEKNPVLNSPFLDTLDLNGDGHLDLVFAGTDLFVFNSEGVLSLPSRISANNTPLKQAVASDLNNDGFVDILAIDDRSMIVYYGTGSGVFDNPEQFEIPRYHIGAVFGPPEQRLPRTLTNIAVGDLDSDGFSDVVVSSAQRYSGDSTGTIHVFHGSAIGLKDQPIEYHFVDAVERSLLLDIDSDDHLDIVAISGYGGVTNFLLNDGYGTFGQFSASDVFSNAVKIRAIEGGFETSDGYKALRQSLAYGLRTSSLSVRVLMSVKARQQADTAESFSTIAESLIDVPGVYAFIVDARFEDASGSQAVGLDGDGNAIVLDGNGGFFLRPGGRAVSGAGVNDYVQLALAVGGTSWDIDLLKAADGQAAFEAFVSQTVTEVQKSMGLKVISSDPRVQIDNLTGTLNGIAAGDSASFDVRFHGSDVPQTFDLLFIREESGSILGSIPVQINSPEYRYQVTAIDPDNDVLVYSLLSGPSGASIDSQTGLLRWSPSMENNYSFEIEVSDSKGGVARQVFEVLVQRGDNNLAPTITTQEALKAYVGVDFSKQILASDPDGDALTYFVVDAPRGASINETTGELAWKPTGAQLGRHSVQIMVIDARGKRATQTLVFNIENPPRNSFPRMAAISNVVLEANSSLNLTATAVDAENDKLVWDLPIAPPGMVIDAETGEISWTVPNYRVAPYDVLVRVRDGRGGLDMRSFTIQSTPRNTPPEIDFIGQAQAIVGLPRLLQVYAQDADNDVLTYSVQNAPAGLQIDSSLGLISWTPTTPQIGSLDFSVIVSDNHGGITEESVTLSVVANAPNTIPAIADPGRLNAKAGTAFQYQFVARDADGDPLRFSITSAPAGMNINANGLLTWTPTLSQLGEVVVNATVADGRGGTASLDVTINVVESSRNTPPVVLSTPVTNAVVDQVYAYDIISFDQDGDPIQWTLTNAPTGMSLDQQRGTIRWRPTIDQIGKHVIVLFALDDPGSGFAGFAGMDHVFTIDVKAVNTPPLITSAPPTSATVSIPYRYAVQASDADSNRLRYAIVAAPAGVSIDPINGLISWLPSSAQQATHNVTVRVDDENGGFATQSYQVVVGGAVLNAPPLITSTPNFRATSNLAYQYQVTAADPEGQTIRYSVTGAPSGLAINSNNGLVTWTPTGSQVGVFFVEVVATDPQGAKGIQRYSLEVLGTNATPRFLTSPALVAKIGRTYLQDLSVADDDLDPLSFRLLKSPSGMTINPATGQIQWKPANNQIGTHEVEVQVNDGRGGIATLNYAIVVQLDSNQPKLDIAISQNPVMLGDTVSILLSASDDVAISQLELTVAGLPLTLNALGQARFTANQAGSITVLGRATDEQGQSIQQSVVLQVVDPASILAPVAIINDPIESRTLRSFTNVVGSVTGDLSFYTLSLAKFGTDDFQEIARGMTRVDNANLGTIDPTLLANDTYILRLRAVGPLGHESIFDRQINISGDLKLGNYTVSFNDMTLPVAGIPITVTRTYDTLQSQEAGEFGYGWRLEFRDTNLRTSVEPSGLEDELIYNPFRVGTKVYLQLPGGKREGFTFKPVLASGLKGSFLGVYEPAFEADPGVTSTLNVAKMDLAVTPDGDFLSYGSALAYHPTSPVFGGTYVVTTSGGIAYEIDGESGDLLSVSDNVGNVLTYSETAIESSAGPKITFERDRSNRITAVVDPAGNKVVYIYDAQGNLTSVIDREANETKYIYRTDRAHYLESILDPLGRTGIRTEYDSAGRLLKIVDAAGQEIRQQYDLVNSIVSVFDQLGNATVYEYDDIGNVVAETDALGGVTTRTYDAAGNVLTEIDPLGRKTTRTYDRDRNVLSETNDLGQTTTTLYERITFGTSIMAKIQGAASLPFSVPSATVDALGNVTTSTYDGRGNLLTSVDASGVSTTVTYGALGLPSAFSFGGGTQSYEYDSAGRVTKQTDAVGVVTEFAYDSNGNQTTSTTRLTTPAGVQTLVTRMEYDANNRLVKTTDAEGGVSQVVYDQVGNQVATIDAIGRMTSFAYDTRGLLLETIFPDATPQDLTDNPRVKSEYDAAGREIAKIDEAGRRTEYRYDALGRMIETIYPDETPAVLTDNPRTKTEYDASGQVIAEIDELGYRTEYGYDQAGRQIFMRDALGNVTQFEYDPAGRLISVRNALGYTTRYVYDASGKRTEQIAPNGAKVLTSYNASGRLAASTDELGRTTRYEYDAAGRLTAVVDALNQRTEYGYDEAGNLVLQKDAEGRITRYEYDGLGRRTATVLPLGQRSSNVYDAVGNLTISTDFNGQAITYSYNNRDWLVGKEYASGQKFTYGYTATGFKNSYIDSRGTTTWGHDSRDRLLRRTEPDGKSVAYTYDAAGNRTSLTSDAGTVAYVYNGLHQLTKVTDPQGLETRYLYNAVGNQVGAEFPTGFTESRTYDRQNRLLSIQTSKDGAVYLQFDYTLAANGRRDAVTEIGGRRVAYEYDALDRLTKEEIVDAVFGDRTISYSYDKVGNRLIRNDSVEGTSSYSYDLNDRLLSEILDGVETQYSYDNNGNTLSKINSTDRAFYNWDAENRLVGVDADGDGVYEVENQYDADGIRVSQKVSGTETRYLIDEVQPYRQAIEEYTPGGVISVSYVHGNDLISQNRTFEGKYYYHVDGLGSTRALSNTFLGMTTKYSYDAFGRLLNSPGGVANNYLFAGEQRDSATGLDYLRDRYYSYASGTFISMDRHPSSFAPRTIHRYTYTAANPINLIDPSGKFFIGFSYSTLLGVTGTASYLNAYALGFGIAKIAVTSFTAEHILSPALSVRNDAMIRLADGVDQFGGVDQLKRIEEANRLYAAGIELLGVSVKAIGIIESLRSLRGDLRKAESGSYIDLVRLVDRVVRLIKTAKAL